MKLGIRPHRNQPYFDVTMWWYRVLISYRSYGRRARYRALFYSDFRSARYRYRCCVDTDTNSGTNVHTGTRGTGVDVVTNLPKCPVPVLMSYRIYQSIRHQNWGRTELTYVSGTGIDVVPEYPKCPVPVLMLYRTYRRVRYRHESLYRYRRYRYPWRAELTEVRYRYWCRTGLTEVSSTGLMSYRTYRSVWYR